jgi:HEAT repeat protein
VLQGRAAEALGLIGDKTDAPAIGQMVRTHMAAGVLANVQPEDMTSPLAPPVEAVRLGLFALARLGTYEPLASAVLGADGQPSSRWWPVAYALQRVGDARGASALLTLLSTPGRYTASFAVRGLASAKATQPQALAAIRAEVEQPRDPAVMIQAIRALGALNDRGVAAADDAHRRRRAHAPAIRLEAMNTLATLADARTADILVELVSDPAPAMRGTAMRALARVDPETFTGTLSGSTPTGLDVRVAQAGALGGLPTARGSRACPRWPTTPTCAWCRRCSRRSPRRRRRGRGAASRQAAGAGRGGPIGGGAGAGAAQGRRRGADLRTAYAAAAGDAAYTARASILAALAQLDSRRDPAAARPGAEGQGLGGAGSRRRPAARAESD